MDPGSGSQIPTMSNSSAIPRISKLPTPRTGNTDGTKQITNIPGPPATRNTVLNSTKPLKSSSSTTTSTKLPSGISTTVPRLQKRASIASFSSATTSSSRETSNLAKPATAQGSVVNRTSRSLVRPTAISRASSARPSSVISKQRQPLAAHQTSHVGSAGTGPQQIASLGVVRPATPQGKGEDANEPIEDVSSGTIPRLQKAPRPSLSDRTIGSLQAVPGTPKDRRKSNFFNPSESPMGSSTRPGSSLSQNDSNTSRPGTSDGSGLDPLPRFQSPAHRVPSSAKPTRVSSTAFGMSQSNAGYRSASAGLAVKSSDIKKPITQAAVASSDSPALPGAGSRKSRLPNGSQATALKPPKLRPSFGDVTAAARTETQGLEVVTSEFKRSVSSSSAALRQQIAAAKAAARKDRAKIDSPQDSSVSSGRNFELGMHADPFNQAPKDGKHILRNRINNARMEGKLNVAAMGLKQIPEEVLQMYSATSMEESNVNWAEVVDLTKLIAADNELESLGDLVFPDHSADDLAADDQTEGNQFGGLELLDLHGNMLQQIPLGIRRLERLTALNLSHNKLENSALDIICQIKSLKDLRLGHNALSGNLPISVCELMGLETLDLQANRLLGLPEAIRELASLKVLNVSGNQLTALPMESLQQIPLLELDASSNALIASLFPVDGEGGHATLQVLNVANNSLAALTFTPTLDLRQLRSLNVTNNHLTVLPSVAGWSELSALQVADNKISDFPFGFTSLQKLRNANFTSNEIRLLDPEISRMTSLDSLILASNPLREKKFLTMSTANLKRDLRSRMAPSEIEEEAFVSANSSPVTVIEAADSATGPWTLQGNGLLDLTSTDLSDDDNDNLSSFLQTNEVKQVLLRKNKFTCIPPSLGFGQNIRILDLSDVNMNMDFLTGELSLPSLQELNLSRCRLSSLEPLIANLHAPRVQSLNVATNRLAGALPPLRNTYPLLTMLLASDNRLTSVSAEALLGLQTVNLASNDIAHVPPEIGLLWDEGLKTLEIGSNAFRVPNYRILEKGTEATLRWLRDRLPASALQTDL